MTNVIIVYYNGLQENDVIEGLTVRKIGQPMYDNTVMVWGTESDGTKGRRKLRCTTQYEILRPIIPPNH